METANFFEWLAGGPFFWFAAITGAVVSLDVIVVEATRDYPDAADRSQKGPLQGQRGKMAITHAAFHGLSFLIYTLSIFAFQSLSFFTIRFLDVPDDVFPTLLILFNFVILLFVWWTYRSKINEDHSEKDHPDSEPERFDMRFFVDIARTLLSKLGLPSLPGLTIAGTVAVDMLAVSALLKVWLIPNNAERAVAHYTGNVVTDVSIFASIVFIVVMVAVFLAHAFNQTLKKRIWAIAILRLLEPAVVFYVVAGVIRSMFDFFSVGLNERFATWEIIGIDVLFAILMTITLLISNGLGWKGLIKLSRMRSTHTASGPAPKPLSEIMRELRKKLYALPWALGVMVLIFVSVWISFTTGSEHNHIIEATSYVSFGITIVTAFLLYAPSKTLDRNERERNDSLFAEISCQKPIEFWQRFIGTFAALAILCLHMRLLFAKGSLAIGAVVLWSVYIMTAWGFYNLRRWRFCRVARDASEMAPQRVLDADAGEFATTIGLASAVVAVVAQLIASRPF